jgi:hypothetical protein
MGLNYVTDAIVKYHNEDLSRAFVKNTGGVKTAIPRYYRERIYPLQGIELRGQTQTAINESELQKRIDHSKINSPNTYEVDDYYKKLKSIQKQEKYLRSKRIKI